jgi:chorismate mutase
MFNKDGTPLRAIGKATFVESISQELIAEKAKKLLQTLPIKEPYRQEILYP